MLPPRPRSGDKAEEPSASTFSSRDRGCPPNGLRLPQLPMTAFLSSPVPGHRRQKPGIIKSPTYPPHLQSSEGRACTDAAAEAGAPGTGAGPRVQAGAPSVLFLMTLQRSRAG